MNRLMKQVLLLILFCVGFKGLACTCMMGTPSYNFSRFDHVFIGKVTEVVNNGANSAHTKQIKVLRIENFKGDSINLISISRPNRGMCPVPNPKLNEHYIFYASEEQGQLSLFACNPSKRIYGTYNETEEFDLYGINELRLIKNAKEKLKTQLKLNFVIRNNPRYTKYRSGLTGYLVENTTQSDYEANIGLYLVRFMGDGKTVRNVEIYASLGAKVDEHITLYCLSDMFWRYQRDKTTKQQLGGDLVIPIVIKKPWR